MAARKKSRSAAVKRAWQTRRRKARERSERAQRAAKTRRKNMLKRVAAKATRIKRARKGWKQLKERRVATPPVGFVWFPAISARVEPVPQVKRAPEVLTAENLETMIADFAQRKMHPDQWARDLSNFYDLEIGPLYKVYFAALYRR